MRAAVSPCATPPTPAWYKTTAASAMMTNAAITSSRVKPVSPRIDLHLAGQPVGGDGEFLPRTIQHHPSATGAAIGRENNADRRSLDGGRDARGQARQGEAHRMTLVDGFPARRAHRRRYLARAGLHLHRLAVRLAIANDEQQRDAHDGDD